MILFVNATLIPAQSQKDLNTKAKTACEKAENKMSMILEKIKKLYESDTIFISKLIISQNSWEKYRDSHLDALYPKSDKSYYGTVFPMCYYNIKTYLTNKRIQEIMKWINGSFEGDVCSGSMKLLQKNKKKSKDSDDDAYKVPSPLDFACRFSFFNKNGKEAGFIRFLRFNYGYEHIVSHAYLQWIAISRPQGPDSIVQSVSIDEINNNFYSISEPKTHDENGKTNLIFNGYHTYTNEEAEFKITISGIGKYSLRKKIIKKGKD